MPKTDIQVLDEGPHHVVVHKLPGALVVPARGVPAPVLLEDVQRRFGKGVRAVHRLDRGTSGCVIFAKSPFGEQCLSEAFRRRRVDKRYLAWVEGRPDFTQKVVDAPLLRHDAPSGKRGPAAIQRVDAQGQSAITHIRVLAVADALTLIEAKPHTGRMHQIRVHCAYVGIPLVGDAMYGARLEASRVLLHAWSLCFPAPSGGRRVCESPLPLDFISLAERHQVDLAHALAPVQAALAAQREKAKKTAAKGTMSAPPNDSARHKNLRGRSRPGTPKSKPAPFPRGRGRPTRGRQ